MGKLGHCCVRYLRNWLFWTNLLIALLGILLALILALQPCEPKITITTTLTTSAADIDLVFVIDNSGSVSNDNIRLEYSAAASFLNALQAQYQGENFRAGQVDFATTAGLVRSITDYSAEELVPVLNSTDERTTNGGTATNLGLQTAFDHLTANSKNDTFKFIVLVTDGSANDQNAALAAASAAKSMNVTLAGIIIGISQNAGLQLYSLTSCTPEWYKDRVELSEMDLKCPYFAQANNFRELQNRAITLANALAVTVPSTSASSDEETVTCVEAEYFGFLALIFPLLAYFLLMPIVYFIKQACCPKKKPERARPPPASATAAPPPEPKPALPKGKNADGSWGRVDTGGYLWAMEGKGTGIVEVNFGDQAPPSAPQAHLDGTRGSHVNTSAVVHTAEEIYGGGEVQAEASQYICCCIWMCLSEEEKAELRSDGKGDYDAGQTIEEEEMTNIGTS